MPKNISRYYHQSLQEDELVKVEEVPEVEVEDIEEELPHPTKAIIGEKIFKDNKSKIKVGQLVSISILVIALPDNSL